MKTNSKEFKKLQKEWYAKLKKEGFDDIEKNGQLMEYTYMKIGAARNKGKSWEEQLALGEAKSTYYRLAEHFLNDYKFPNQLQRIIWEYHSQGISLRDIVTILAKEHGILTYKDKTFTVIRELKRRMFEMYKNDFITENEDHE